MILLCNATYSSKCVHLLNRSIICKGCVTYKRDGVLPTPPVSLINVGVLAPHHTFLPNIVLISNPSLQYISCWGVTAVRYSSYFLLQSLQALTRGGASRTLSFQVSGVTWGVGAVWIPHPHHDLTECNNCLGSLDGVLIHGLNYQEIGKMVCKIFPFLHL